MSFEQGPEVCPRAQAAAPCDSFDRQVARLQELPGERQPCVEQPTHSEVRLAQAGIGTDILGIQRESLPVGLADEVHALLPRMDLAYALSDAIVSQAKSKPHKASPMTFPGTLLRHHLPYGGHPTWYDLLGAAGWGDKPVGAVARHRAGTPEQVGAMFTEYLEAGDIEGLVSLYEPHAHFVPTPGTHLVGTGAIRKALQQLIDNGARLTLELRDIRPRRHKT